MAVAIEYGGGPTLEQRTAFCSEKYGVQKPGYTGYCPQIKYNPGHTYGDQTHLCALKFPHVSTDPESRFFGKPPLRNVLPKANGDLKYTESMKSGYSGYVPRLLFKFGGTYPETSDEAVDEYISNLKKKKQEEKELQSILLSFPQLQAINHDPEVRDHMNVYSDCLCKPPVLQNSKRPLLEPAKFGYTGWIPRIRVTPSGCGTPYTKGNEDSLARFDYETKKHFEILKMPVNVLDCPSSTPQEAFPPNYKRIYKKDGMIPRYTGYVPYFLFDYGKTYGDSTKNLEECSHDYEHYGEFMASKPEQPTQIIS